MYCLVDPCGLHVNQKFKTSLLAIFISVICWVQILILDIQTLS